MKVRLGGVTIYLPDKDVAAAKKTFQHFMDTSIANAEEQGAMMYKYVLPVVAYMMAEARIKAITPEVLNLITAKILVSEKESADNQNGI